MLSGSREITCGKILIVDDDEAIRETLSQVLELSGFDSITSSNGQEALALLRSSTLPCLVLLDLMMPIMNGWAFMDAVKNEDTISSVPIVVMTAYRTNELPAL